MLTGPTLLDYLDRLWIATTPAGANPHEYVLLMTVETLRDLEATAHLGPSGKPFGQLVYRVVPRLRQPALIVRARP